MPLLPVTPGIGDKFKELGVADCPDPSGGFHELQATAQFFYENRAKPWTTEQQMAVRTQALLTLLTATTGMELRCNEGGSAVTEGSRLDAFVSYPQSPPLLLVEEKAQEANLNKAISDLTNKFRWLDHYRFVGYTFVFGLAIAGNKFAFGKLTGVGDASGTFTPIKTFDTSSAGGIVGETQAIE